MVYELLYYLNYGILAAFLSLFSVEMGMALHSLIGYERNRERIRHYVMPLWEITGTFAVFYATSLVATYPNLIPVIAPIYIGPVVAAALLLIIRNSFLGFSEVMGKHEWDRAVFATYSVSTILVGFVLSAMLGSAVSGIGVSPAAGTVELVPMLFNLFDIGVFAALAAIGFVAASALLSERGIGPARKLVVPVIFIAVMAFGAVQNQSLFGGASSLADFVTNTASAQYLVIATLCGGTFLAAALLYFVYMTFLKKAR